MDFLRRLSLAQRLVLVVGLGLGLWVAGNYIVASATFGPQVGWFGYAPLDNHFINIESDLAPWQQMLIWLGLVLAWTIASIFILHRPGASANKLTDGGE